MEEQRTTQQVIAPIAPIPPSLRNPTGKGGFGDNPQNRNPGGWKKEQSISYQYNLLIRLNVQEFRGWIEANPEEKRTMAQDIAYHAVLRARKDLNYLKEITDRVEGKPQQYTDHTTLGKEIAAPAIISTIQPRTTNAQTQTETATGS